MSNQTVAEIWMEEALKEARKARVLGEVPVGAVLVHQGEIVARAHNEVETRRDATRHAEMLVIERASKHRGDWRLSDTTLIVTLEPCPMCLGAMLLSRVANLYFGCYDPRQGAVGSVFDISNHPHLPASISVHREVLADECRKELQDFFKDARDPKLPASLEDFRMERCPSG